MAGSVTPLRFAVADTPLGQIVDVVSEDGIVATLVGEGHEIAALRDPRGLAPVVKELDAYFAGRLRRFATPVDLSFAPEGFARRVIQTTLAVPYGELRTYGDIADAAEAPRAGRAAGSVLARCPIEIFVPCHRVVSAGKSLGGYGAHPERKAFLVNLEAGVSKQLQHGFIARLSSRIETNESIAHCQ